MCVVARRYFASICYLDPIGCWRCLFVRLRFFCRVQFKSTAMHCAALTGHVDVVAMLAANGGDVKKCTMDGVSPLDSARMEGHNAVVAYLTDTFTKVRPPSRRSTLSCTRSTDPRAQPDRLSWAALQ